MKTLETENFESLSFNLFLHDHRKFFRIFRTKEVRGKHYIDETCVIYDHALNATYSPKRY